MTLQGIAAVLAGFVGMAAIVMIGSAAASVVMRRAPASPDAMPPGYLAFDYLLGLLAALAGGTIAARLAPFALLHHAMALSALVLAMAVVCAIAYGDNGPPRWYQAAMSLSAAAVVMAGAWLAAPAM